MSGTWRWFLLLSVVVALFFWKILFTSQFSMILTWEGTNQAYAWYNYSARTVQQGILPAWDPFTESGRNFVGETQTGVFYPLKLLLYLWPLDHEGFLSERLFHQMYVLAHLLAAFFMFLCARELGIKNSFAAFVSALCFTLGGFVGKMGWVHLMDSLIWLPLIFFFLLRALRSRAARRRSLYSCGAGLCLGMSILAGSIHVPLMDVMVIVSAAGLIACRPDNSSAAPAALRSRLIASATVVFIVGVASFAAAAVQLLPSMEFSPLARRWTLEWSGPFEQRVPYFVTGGFVRLAPRALFAFLFGGADTGGAEYGPYFGIMPLLLAVIGVWRNWTNPWVKYFTVLGVLAFFYGLGDYSLLHGVSYLLIPYVDKAWEAGRFIYLTHFAMALLAGFGAQSLFSEEESSETCYSRLNRILRWTVIATLVGLGIPALLGYPALQESSYLTLVFLIATWIVFLYITRGSRATLARLVLIAVIVCDLYAFNSTFKNKTEEQRLNADHLEVMKSLRPVADFLKAQPGPFRVHFVSDPAPASMGDVYGIQTTLGYGATMINDYLNALWSPNGMCLFNVRYYLGTGEARPEPPLFTYNQWKVWENPDACPRAWIPPQVVVESPEEVRRRIEQESLDLRQIAYLSEQPLTPLDSTPETPAAITYGPYQSDRFEMDAEVSSTALLVLSEVYHPGWIATINRQPAHIYKVNNILRGLVVSPGRNHIVMEYRPASIRIGAILSALAFLGTFLFAALVFLTKQRTSKPDAH